MLAGVRRIWRELDRLERKLSGRWGSSLYGYGPLAGQHKDTPGSWGGYADELRRVERVREAVHRSKRYAAERLAERLSGIDLTDIWQILIDVCEEIALYFGGAVLLGGAIGGIAGAFAGGVGALPGATIGAGVGAQAGGWILALLGLKSLVEGLGDSLSRAIEYYRIGFLEAWGPSPEHRLNVRKPSGSIFHAASSMAEGHVILILALLSAMIAYLTRGRGNRSQLLKEIHESRSLGPKMANWLEKNEAKLRDHPLLKPKPAKAAPMAQSAPPVKPRSGPALTPSQLRAERQGPRPKRKSASKGRIDSATRRVDNGAGPGRELSALNRQMDEIADAPFPAKSVGAGKVWSTKARLKSAQLPTSGRIRFVPRKGYEPSNPLARGPNNGFIDRFGNEWVRGPSRTEGQAFEWDVQLSRTGREEIGWLTRDGSHANVSLDGKITHR